MSSRSSRISPTPWTSRTRGGPRSGLAFLVLATFFLFCLATSAGESTQGRAHDPNPNGPAHSQASADWLEEAQRKIADAEYEISWQADTKLGDIGAAWHAPNRAHAFRTYFTNHGIRVVPRTEEQTSWKLGLTLFGYGRGDDLRPVGGAALTPVEKRIDYRRGDLVEWYVNEPTGLEQGFTLPAPPEMWMRSPLETKPRFLPGARRSVPDAGNDGSAAFLVLRLTGGLSPRVSADGQAVDFASPSGGISVLRYAELKVLDAEGRELPAWIEGFAEAGIRGIRLVFDDADAVYPLTVDPLLTSPAWTAVGNQEWAGFGSSVAGAGDVNGDDYDDVIVSAPRYDDGPTSLGRVYVYHGSASGLSIAPAWTLKSDQFDPYFVVFGPVAGAGDVNGDGYHDVIVGAPGYDNGEAADGAAFVFHGSASGLPDCGIVPCTPADADWTAVSNDEAEWLGSSVSTAGDVNGDGFDDVIVKAPEDISPSVGGRIYVYHGSEDGLVTGTASWEANLGDWIGSTSSHWKSRDTSTAGDVNRDGYDDIVIGGPRDNGAFGAAYVFHGSIGGLVDCGGPCEDVDADWTFDGVQDRGYLGYSVSTAGDVNGDGFDDVIVGAPQPPRYGVTEVNNGWAYVFEGSPTGLRTEPGWVAEGDEDDAQFGYSVSTAGDVDGDGYADVIVGAPFYDPGGRAFLYQGSPTGLAPVHAWTSMTESGLSGAFFGQSVAGAGDVNGDGLDDVIVGAPNYTYEEGAAFAYHGARTITAWDLASDLGLAPLEIRSVSWAVDSGGTSLGNNETPEAVFFGSVPESVLVTTGRLVDGEIVDVDWGSDGAGAADGLADVTTIELELNVPPSAGTLRFTTQFLTNEQGGTQGDPYDTDSASAELFLDGWSVGVFPLDDPTLGPVTPPTSHCINVAGAQLVKLRFSVEDTDGSEDSGLLITKTFFSPLPFPPDITPEHDGVDANGDGVADYFANPAPSDVSLTTGTYTYVKELLSIPAHSLPFRFSILYNSQSDRAESLGRKWSHSYLGYTQVYPADANGDVVALVRHGAGTAEYFVAPGGSSVYQPKYPGTFSTLTEEAGGDFTLVTKSHLTYEFEEPGATTSQPGMWLLSRVTDPNGNSSELTYGTYQDEKKVASVIDTTGRAIRFVYDESGNLTSVEHDWQTLDDPPANVTSEVSFEYDPSTNDLISFADLNGHTTTLDYDDAGNLLTVTDPNGLPVVANSFEQFHGINLLQVGDRVVTRRNGRDADPFDPGAGVAYAYEREAMTQTDRLGRTETRLYDVKGRFVRRIDPTDVQWDFAYDRHGNTTETLRKLPSEDWPEKTSAMVYDDSGNLRHQEEFPGTCIGGSNVGSSCQADTDCPDSSCGVRTSMTYDAHDNLLTETDHLGHTSSFAYDVHHNLLSETDPLGNSTAHAYTPTGQRASTTDPRGNATTFEYDPQGYLSKVTDALGGETTETHDNMGRRASATDANGNTALYEWDDAGRLRSRTDALGGVIQFTRDAEGRVLTMQRPDGSTYTNAYTPTGQIDRASDPLGHEISNEYDAEDRRVSFTDFLGLVTTYDYDDADRLTRVAACDPQVTTFCDPLAEVSAEYDEAGNRWRILDPKGNPTRYEHDRLGRVVREIDADGNAVANTYDGRGLLTSTTNARGQRTSYSYDAAGRLTRVDLPTGSITNVLDANGNPVFSVSDRLGSVSRSFDALNRLDSRTDEFGNTVGYRYDAAGNLVELTYPTDADGSGGPDTVRYEYDELNRLKAVCDWSCNPAQCDLDVSDLSDCTAVYVYDDVGNVTQTSLPDGSAVVHAYDLAGRLTAITDVGPAGTNFAVSYTLDAAGRRLSASLTLPLGLEPDITEASHSLQYNQLNQLTGRGNDTYHYDADGNLTSGVLGGDPVSLSYNEFHQLVQLNTDSFRYDVDGLRVEATRAGTTTRYVHDPTAEFSRLLEEHDADGNLVARYVYGLGLISRTDDGGNRSVYHFDSRGSTVALTDDTGNITDAYAYDPYGEVTRDAVNATPNPFTYNGRDGVFDDENGLYYMRARYYSAELKRFIQKDQVFQGDLTQTQSLNRYAFVQGNPIQFVDPNGEWGWSILGGAVIGVGVTFVADLIDDGELNADPGDYVKAFFIGGISGAVSDLKKFEKLTWVGKFVIGEVTAFIGGFVTELFDSENGLLGDFWVGLQYSVVGGLTIAALEGAWNFVLEPLLAAGWEWTKEFGAEVGDWAQSVWNDVTEWWNDIDFFWE